MEWDGDAVALAWRGSPPPAEGSRSAGGRSYPRRTLPGRPPPEGRGRPEAMDMRLGARWDRAPKAETLKNKSNPNAPDMEQTKTKITHSGAGCSPTPYHGLYQTMPLFHTAYNNPLPPPRFMRMWVFLISETRVSTKKINPCFIKDMKEVIISNADDCFSTAVNVPQGSCCGTNNLSVLTTQTSCECNWMGKKRCIK